MHCSQLHSAQLEQWNDASFIAHIYTCAVTNVIWKLFMATSIGAKGIENKDVIASIPNVLVWLLLCAFKDRHVKGNQERDKAVSVP